MRHFLPAMRADIGEQAIARFDQIVLARDMTHRADETGDFGVRLRLREKSSQLT